MVYYYYYYYDYLQMTVFCLLHLLKKMLRNLHQLFIISSKMSIIGKHQSVFVRINGWSLSLLPIGTGVMLSIFANLLGCEQLVCCPTQIAGNRLDLVMMDVPDIDVFIGIPLGTSDHCFVSCVLRVEQSVPEYNIGSTIFLKHRTNWDNVHCAVRSFTSRSVRPSYWVGHW